MAGRPPLTDPSIRTAGENWELVKVRLDLDDYPNLGMIVCIECGKDVENLPGFHGAQFAFEYIRVFFDQEAGAVNRSLTDRMHYRRVQGDLPFSSNFNDGMGTTYFFDGTASGSPYNNFADFDVNPTYMFSHRPTSAEFVKRFFQDCIPINDIEVEMEPGTAFYGTSSMSLSFKYRAERQTLVHKMYKCYFPAADDLTVAAAIQTIPLATELYWLAKLSDGSFRVVKIELAETRNGWAVSRTKLVAVPAAGLFVKSIYLCARLPVSADRPVCPGLRAPFPGKILLGHFSLYQPSKHWLDEEAIRGRLQARDIVSQGFLSPKTAVMPDCGKGVADIQLAWNVPKEIESLIMCYRVYVY